MSSKTSRPRPGPAPATANGKPPPTANAWSRPLQPKKAATGPPPGMGAPPILRERFLHLTLSMVGHRVVVTQTDGTVFEGIFHTFTPFTSQSTQMKNKYVIKACKAVKGDIATGATVIVSAEDVSSVFLKSMRLDTKNGGTDGFRTDVEISSAPKDGKGRDLVAAGSAWTQPRKQQQPAGLRGNIGEWDQFKANEELFNVSASYDENLYTTELDKSQIDARKKMEAEKLAKEIEGTTSSNIHIAEERGHVIQGDYDEEDRYSGVLKSSLQPRNPAPKAPEPAAAAKPAKKSEDVVEKSAKAEPAAKPSVQVPKKMNYAEAAAKADAKAALPPGFAAKGAAAPALVSPARIGKEDEVTKKDEKKEEETLAAVPTSAPEKVDEEEKPAPVTPTPAEEAKEEKTDEATATAAEEKVEEKAESSTQEKKTSKLNVNAKAFTFNPAAKPYTPSFAASVSTPPESAPVDPNTGLPLGGPGAPPMPGQPQYMPHPGMGQPGMMPMMNPHFAAMRFQGGPYPGMEHQMPMQHPHQPQNAQQQTPASREDSGSPAPPLAASGEESEGSQTHPQQPPGQPVPVPYGGAGPPGSYYPGMMPPRGGPGFHPHHPPQMGPPVAGNPYHPMYGGPMPVPNMQMRGPGGGGYYPPMGGMPYPPGAYGGGMVEDDQGYRGGRGGRGPRRNSRNKSGGRGRGGGYYSGGSGRQTPQSNSGVEDGGDGTDSKTSASPTGDSPPPKPAVEEPAKE